MMLFVRSTRGYGGRYRVKLTHLGRYSKGRSASVDSSNDQLVNTQLRGPRGTVVN